MYVHMSTMNIESSAKTELSFVEMRIIRVDKTKMQEIGMSSREGIITSSHVMCFSEKLVEVLGFCNAHFCSDSALPINLSLG
jgi:hypothetical protein